MQDLLYRSPYLEMDIHASYCGPRFKMVNQTTHFIWQYLASRSHERGIAAWNIWIVFLFVSIDSYSVDTHQVGWLAGLLIKRLYLKKMVHWLVCLLITGQIFSWQIGLLFDSTVIYLVDLLFAFWFNRNIFSWLTGSPFDETVIYLFGWMVCLLIQP